MKKRDPSRDGIPNACFVEVQYHGYHLLLVVAIRDINAGEEVSIMLCYVMSSHVYVSVGV